MSVTGVEIADPTERASSCENPETESFFDTFLVGFVGGNGEGKGTRDGGGDL